MRNCDICRKPGLGIRTAFHFYCLSCWGQAQLPITGGVTIYTPPWSNPWTGTTHRAHITW